MARTDSSLSLPSLDSPTAAPAARSLSRFARFLHRVRVVFGGTRLGVGLALGLFVGLGIGLLFALFFGGCAAEYPFVRAEDYAQDKVPGTQDRAIEVRDTLSIVVKDQPPLSGEFVVRENGAYLQPLVGDVFVQGLSEADASARLAEKLHGILTNPVVAISVSKPASVFVSVLGEVRQPGNYELSSGEGVLNALARAGGLNEFAKSDRIFVLRRADQASKAKPGLRIRFNFDDLTGGAPKSSTFVLRDGDVVVVD